MSTAGYLVEGMTCGYCMGKVHEKVRSLPGVTKVAMDLVAGGRSPLLVMSATKVGADAVRKAVKSAGFGLLSADIHTGQALIGGAGGAGRSTPALCRGWPR